MTESPNAPRRPSRVERAEQTLGHWREQAALVERESAGMIWIPRIGVPVGLVVAFVAKWWLGLGVVILTLVAWAMGRYMIIVRRAEFAHHVRDAEAGLAAVRRDAGQHDGGQQANPQAGETNG